MGRPCKMATCVPMMTSHTKRKERKNIMNLNVTFRNGKVVRYTGNVLSMLLEDDEAVIITNADTGELIKFFDKVYI